MQPWIVEGASTCTLTLKLERLDLTLGEKDLKDLEYSYIHSMQKDLVSPYSSASGAFL
jgi:hypothetical protein